MPKDNKKKQPSESSCDKNGGCCDGAAGGGGGDGSVDSLQKDQLMKLKQAMEMMQMQQQAGAGPKSADEAAKKNYEFWSTQPVPKLDEEITSNEPIQEDIPLDKLRKEPYTLPSGFHWDELNIDDPLVLKELYVLLTENYVEDDDSMFRFDYSPEFLSWALNPPGSIKDWKVGVRITKSKKLIGFISAIPAKIKVYEKVQNMVEINFLCVLKKLRSKRLAPVLIREITRRVNCKGIFQAVYTAGIVLPKPVGTCRYWHRSLNPKKLIEVNFCHLSRNMTMQRYLKLYRLPEETKTAGLRPMKASDVPKVVKLLNDFLTPYDLRPVFDEEDVSHWFLPKENVVYSFVVTESTGKKEEEIVDFLSFYSLPSTVVNHPQHKTLNAAYAFYNVCRKNNWVDLMGDALILAKKKNFDVFNALDLMENEEFLEKLKFGIGDGNLQYYLYNWRCPSMTAKKIGLVLQ